MVGYKNILVWRVHALINGWENPGMIGRICFPAYNLMFEGFPQDIDVAGF
jgi:hypothetical protein